MLLPTTLPTAMSVWPEVADCMDTANSGAPVPYATTVNPTTRGEIPNLRASFEAPRTRSSAPNTSAPSPNRKMSRLKTSPPWLDHAYLAEIHFPPGVPCVPPTKAIVPVCHISANLALALSLAVCEAPRLLFLQGRTSAPEAQMPETFLEWAELLSYVVTIVGLPLAIYVFALEQRKERQAEEEVIHQRLSDEYNSFLKLVIDNADLQLLSREGVHAELSAEQRERKQAIFGILVALFERAYILVYEEDMDKQRRRLWQSWEDYMRDWCKRRDFREALPELLEGEDLDFAGHILPLAGLQA